MLAAFPLSRAPDGNHRAIPLFPRSRRQEGVCEASAVCYNVRTHWFVPVQTHTQMDETYCTDTHTHTQPLCLPILYIMTYVILKGKCQLLSTLWLITFDVGLNWQISSGMRPLYSILYIFLVTITNKKRTFYILWQNFSYTQIVGPLDLHYIPKWTFTMLSWFYVHSK